MSELTIKLVEVEANKLNKDSKYIFLIDEAAGLSSDNYQQIAIELERLLGDNFTIISMNGINNLKVYSVEDK